MSGTGIRLTGAAQCETDFVTRLHLGKVHGSRDGGEWSAQGQGVPGRPCRFLRGHRFLRGLPTRSQSCDYGLMTFRHAFIRALAILLIGSLACAPLAASAAGLIAVADAQAMSSDMAMDSASAAADEMPCHKDKSDPGKPCPVMAICMALCCQGLSVSHVTLAAPIRSESRILPAQFVRLDGVNFPPPSRPPKT
jgi:hypothetical protein